MRRRPPPQGGLHEWIAAADAETADGRIIGISWMARRSGLRKTAADAEAWMMNRREFVLAAAAVAATAAGSLAQTPDANDGGVVAFDAFAIFDPRPIGVLASELFPGRGAELMAAWRTRQFEYTWLRSTAGQYADFWITTRDALVYAARSIGIDLPADRRDRLLEGYLQLSAYPDVRDGLQRLQKSGRRLAILSNFTAQMLKANTRNAGLDGAFDQLLSTDAVKLFKPAPAAYRMAMDAFGVTKDRVTFVPFASWDAAGAKWFGYRTFWLNRQRVPSEELGTQPDGMGASLEDLDRFLQA